ncbi:hypothetical protein [Hymenobacter sp. AT01-02]|uniref:hypothetical protein n=1 Tax=Hymenobacter sp. AT01-02 TaxID=1571877 RepID=UPI0006E1F66D|nr:hypothetical protein [Hymenobacter sp. AT01-02]
MDSCAGLHMLNRALEAAPILPFACAWVRREHIPSVFRPVYYYVGAKVFLYALAIVSRTVFRNDIYLFHLATVLLVVLLAYTYGQLLPKRWQRPVQVAVALFLGVAVLDASALNGLFTDVNTYSQTFGCALLILLAILHIVTLTQNATDRALESQPSFFLSVGVIVYCSCSVVSYVAVNIIYHAGYDMATGKRLDTLFSSPDTFLMAVQMALFAWMFCFFQLNASPLRALPTWLHYSSWAPRSYRLLGRRLSQLKVKHGRLIPRVSNGHCSMALEAPVHS